MSYNSILLSHPALKDAAASESGESGNMGSTSRRDFMKLCGMVAVALGMDVSMAGKVAAALESPNRPSILYMHGAECTGCTEALLRSTNPYLDDLIINTISLDYCETVMAAAGAAAHHALETAMKNKNGYICLVEGAIPMRDNGMYGCVGDESMLSLIKRVAVGAKAVVAIGTCSCFGGLPAAKPNPSQSMSVADALKDEGIVTVNVAGCPPNPITMVGTLVHFLMKGLPELDYANRPLPFYQYTVHDKCPRREHFDKGEFALSFASEEARKGWCLYELGCRGPFTYNNCPTAKFNDASWPVQGGSPCIGCSEPNFWDVLAPFHKDVD